MLYIFLLLIVCCRGEAELSQFTFMKQDNLKCQVTDRERSYPPQRGTTGPLLTTTGTTSKTGMFSVECM